MQSFQNTFVSSTNWTERIGPTAALATLNKYLKFSVEEKLINTGNLVKNIWKKNAQKHNLKIDVSGLPSLCSFAFDSKNPIEMNTFFNISMLQTGILGFRQFKPSFAHSEKDLKKYNEAVNLIFGEISKNKNKLKIESDLHHTGFQRLTKE